MSFVVIIPARLASTRLPNKPLLDLGGVPMVVRVAQRAQLSGAELVVVATDHLDIVHVCEAYGIKAYLTREDHVSGTDRISEVAAELKFQSDTVVVNVQGDEPFIDPQLIAATAKLITPEVAMATAAYPIVDVQDVFNPNVVKVVLNRKNHALYFSRAPIPWHRDEFVRVMNELAHLPKEYTPLHHIGLYAYRCDFLMNYATLMPAPLEQVEMLEQLRVLWHGLPIAVHVTEVMPQKGVDTQEDAIRAQKYFDGRA